MNLQIKIDIDNDAFLYDDGELARILGMIAQEAMNIEATVHGPHMVRDVNGNTVGNWYVGE